MPCRSFPNGIPVFGLAYTHMKDAANDLDIPLWAEMYGDMKNSEDGMLVIDRKKGNWVLEDVRNHVSSTVGQSDHDSCCCQYGRIAGTR